MRTDTVSPQRGLPMRKNTASVYTDWSSRRARQRRDTELQTVGCTCIRQEWRQRRYIHYWSVSLHVTITKKTRTRSTTLSSLLDIWVIKRLDWGLQSLRFGVRLPEGTELRLLFTFFGWLWGPPSALSLAWVPGGSYIWINPTEREADHAQTIHEVNEWSLSSHSHIRLHGSVLNYKSKAVPVTGRGGP
jgi:hypothetical protein